MSNPLSVLQNILLKSKSKFNLSQVVNIDGEKLTTETETGIRLIVWGSAKLLDWVITKDNQILGSIILQDTQTVYIP